MSKKDEYRRLAAASLDSAAHSSDAAAKARLLAMAEAWLDLAGRAGQATKPRTSRIGDHPLVRRMLSDRS
jgi:NAD-dependent oxidoreductase involved in siderophore biosynthesis